MEGPVERSRISIARLMTMVALLALDLAALRLAASSRGVAAELAAMLIPVGLATQVGIDRSIRGQRHLRPFWAGFLASGMVTAAGLVWVTLVEPPGVTSLFRLYIRSFYYLLGTSPDISRAVVANKNLHLIAGSLYLYLPQLLPALAGGAMAFTTSKRKRRDEQPAVHSSVTSRL